MRSGQVCAAISFLRISAARESILKAGLFAKLYNLHTIATAAVAAAAADDVSLVCMAGFTFEIGPAQRRPVMFEESLGQIRRRLKG